MILAVEYRPGWDIAVTVQKVEGGWVIRWWNGRIKAGSLEAAQYWQASKYQQWGLVPPKVRVDWLKEQLGKDRQKDPYLRECIRETRREIQ